MAQIHCNFFSYSLCHGVDIEVTLPSFTSCNMDDPHTHSLPGKFPVVYLLHGKGNDYMSWLRYTSVERYAEEKRIAIVTFSVGNKAYMNDDMGDNYYDFLNQELPEFVEAYFPISDSPKDRYIAGLSMGGYGALLHGIENPDRYSADWCPFAGRILEKGYGKQKDEGAAVGGSLRCDRKSCGRG